MRGAAGPRDGATTVDAGSGASSAPASCPPPETRPPQAPRLHTPAQGSAGAPAAELRPGYNWSLAWSLSASGLTVWPGEGAWGGWETGGRPWDRDIALGTMPSTAAGMPLGATPTTPGGYLLGEEAAHEPGGRPVQGPVPPRSVQLRPRTAPHPPPRRLPPARARVPQLPRASGAQ